MKFITWVKAIWCRLFHSGGVVTRDSEGRIDWQCTTCARWAGNPVDLTEEEWVIERHIRAKQASKPKHSPLPGDAE